MAAYKLTQKAEADIEAIYEYSIENFGLGVARSYIDALFERFDLLADNPSWGNSYDFITPGLRRYEHESHSIYYVSDDQGGAMIVRVLGAKQDPARHF